MTFKPGEEAGVGGREKQGLGLGECAANQGSMAGAGTVKLHSFLLEIFPASIMDSWAGTRLIAFRGVCLTYL